MSEALILAEHKENMLCIYINCSECQNQFLYTTSSFHVLSLEFSRIDYRCGHVVGVGVTFNFDKQDVIDLTKFSKMTMCRASEANSEK